FNLSPRFTDGVVRSRAGRNDAHVRAAQTELHRDHAAGHVADQHRNGERGRARWTLIHQNGELLFERFQSADPAADDGAEAIAIYFVQSDAAVLARHLGGGHRQLHETIRPSHILGIIEKWFRIEIADFAGDFAIVLANIHRGDSADSAFACFERGPERFQIVADRCDSTETCNYDSAIVHKSDG